MEGPRQFTQLLNGLTTQYREEEDAPRERSPQGEAEEQEGDYWSRGRTGYYIVLPPGERGHVLRCGRGTLRFCVVHVHKILKLGSACRQLQVMCKTCLALQVDIVCGDGNQAWYFRSKAHKAERTDATGESHPAPLNGLLNTVARFEVSRLNQGQLVSARVAM